MAQLRWWAEWAWLPAPADGLASRIGHRVLIETSGERISAVRPDTDRPADAVPLPGLTLPGLANAHSHAFHRALRGRTQAGRGTFWTWREQMYAVADRLDPGSYLALARAVYAEMALAGITAVGEFHYLHHAPGGVPYTDPNAMGQALVEAAGAAGIRLTLLDTCYLTGGIGQPLAGPQLRFGDADAHAWAERAGRLTGGQRVRIGAAIHSVRAVPRDQLAPVADWAAAGETVLHAHLSEQRAENTACHQAYGLTPTQLLAEAGALAARTSLVHATHLSGQDLRLIGEAGAYCCLCPTTERDLADGIGPARDLLTAGAGLSLGSDSHAVIDLFEEARAVELDERLRTETRGHFTAARLLEAATTVGHASLGWPDAGRLAPGALADFTTVATDTPRTAGFVPDTAAETLVYAATSADVRHTVVGGRHVVRDGVHTTVPEVGRELAKAIAAVTGETR